MIVATDHLDLTHSCPTITVVGIADTRTDALLAFPGRQYLELHFCEGTRAPRAGEQIGTWQDVTTLYAMAPMRAAGDRVSLAPSVEEMRAGMRRSP